MLSCAALDLMAFQPVRRDAKCTYLVIPKSAGLMISYVEGLLRMALAWIPKKSYILAKKSGCRTRRTGKKVDGPALCVKALNPVI